MTDQRYAEGRVWPCNSQLAETAPINKYSRFFSKASRSFSTLRLSFIAGVIALSGASAASAATYYVDGKNGSDGNSGSEYSPLKTVSRAWYKTKPGDTVVLKPTVTYGPIWLGGKSGYAGKMITLRGGGTGSNMTKVSGRYEGQGIMIEKGRSYIAVENLDVTAPGHGSGGPYSAIFIPGNHHITIRNNYTHNSGCSGIQTAHSDYITITGNRSAYNAKDNYRSIYCSGISTWENKDVDSNTGTKMIISHNAVWGNTNTRSPSCSSPCTNSDGNGIIVDDSRRVQTDYKAYRGTTRIENNLTVYNGGRGIHIYSSDNVTVIGNTSYMNNRDSNAGSWRPGEISVVKSGNVKMYHNILFTDAGYVNKYSGERVSISVQYANKGSIVADHNILYNSKNNAAYKAFTQNNSVSVTIGSGNRFANPKLKNPGSSAVGNDFRPAWGSPAFNFYGPSWAIPEDDFLRTDRSNPATAGAYQNGG